MKTCKRPPILEEVDDLERSSASCLEGPVVLEPREGGGTAGFKLGISPKAPMAMGGPQTTRASAT